MKQGVGKVPKACDPCRRRKIKCNGEVPCQQRDCRTNPSLCIYRSRTRNRRSLKRADSAISVAGPVIGHRQSTDTTFGPDDGEKGASSRGETISRPEVYHSITAANHAPDSTDSARLFYGPSSNFAFLQQVHRGILAHSAPGQLRHHEVQEGGLGLDLFMQRTIFFGTPWRVNVEAIRSTDTQSQTIPLIEAQVFLERFKASSHHRLPFLNLGDINELLHKYYSDRWNTVLPQERAILLAILALGALCTPQTHLAETLILQAKREAAIYDDAVTLQMLQLSLLLADYQINMGRPNSTYLHLGVACRKAFALGLHKQIPPTLTVEGNLENHNLTLWCLYFHETWFSLSLGRKSSLKMDDISCPYPRNHPHIISLCQLARIIEDSVETMYTHRSNSLRLLYERAERVNVRLRQFALENDIASLGLNLDQDGFDAVRSLALHNLYYHAVMLTFRPFLIADSALRSNEDSHHGDEMWLRQACRRAIDAAQDSIIFTRNMYQRSDACRSLRYHSFFLESCCGVLLHDILYHPPKYEYNLEYIRVAIECLDMMIDDEPITTARNSVKRILYAVEVSISKLNLAQSVAAAPEQSNQATASTSYQPAARSGNSHRNHHASFQFPSLDTTASMGAEQMIFFTDSGAQHHNHQHQDTQQQNAVNLMVPDTGLQSGPTLSQPFDNLNLDVMTTDLLNFFPLDVARLS